MIILFRINIKSLKHEINLHIIIKVNESKNKTDYAISLLYLIRFNRISIKFKLRNKCTRVFPKIDTNLAKISDLV